MDIFGFNFDTFFVVIHFWKIIKRDNLCFRCFEKQDRRTLLSARLRHAIFREFRKTLSCRHAVEMISKGFGMQTCSLGYSKRHADMRSRWFSKTSACKHAVEVNLEGFGMQTQQTRSVMTCTFPCEKGPTYLVFRGERGLVCSGPMVHYMGRDSLWRSCFSAVLVLWPCRFKTLWEP